MTIVVAAVSVLTLLVLMNLILTFGVVRKLRTYEAERVAARRGADEAPGLPVGTEIPAFTATTTAGVEVTAESLDGKLTLVGFFSTDCGACLQRVPSFIEAIRGRSAEGMRSLAVVIVGDKGPEPLLEALPDDIHLVMEKGAGDVEVAFQASAFPWFYLVGPDRTIRGDGYEVEQCLNELART
ncbi:AhpC/TSA family protein [Thermomonospora echinospora]|uniref:AhpC/TSA family protein n=1 Tax=Thermomonospora echinospora TaxID=1992 RepID=A0A1H5W5G3_9ACTN|nr:redoxin family protein [Thermomonospora echinospora]SEF94715.1 AhpC/TSA family protein [Thermomonospora echinospora]